MSAGPLTVAVDATSLLGPRTGVGTLTHHLVAGLAGRDDVEVRAFAVTWRGRDGLGPAVPSRVRVVRRPMAARPLHEIWARTGRPAIEAWTGPVDVVHGPNFVVPPTRRAARVVTVHDLTAWRFPDMVDASAARYPRLVARAVAQGAWVHTPSDFVADEVVDRLGVERERVVAVPNGAPDLGPVSDGVTAADGRRRAGADRYVLAVGTVEPRKDLPGLVRAFDAVASTDPDVHLLLVGPDGWGVADLDRALHRATHRDRVVRLGWVDEAGRTALLRGASVVAYPSVYEGFGLVPLEAMAAGVPVVTTRTGAIPEVVGDAALLVDVGDVDEMANALTSALTDEDLRSRLVAAGEERRRAFTWGATVEGLVDLYRRAAESR